MPPALLTVCGTPRRQVATGVGVREARREAPRKSGTRARRRCLAYGNVSGPARAESVKAQWILEDDPPDLIVEKVNRTAGEPLGGAPREGRSFCRASLRTESSCVSERMRRRVDRSQ
jgi:hypothetical protein